MALLAEFRRRRQKALSKVKFRFRLKAPSILIKAPLAEFHSRLTIEFRFRLKARSVELKASIAEFLRRLKAPSVELKAPYTEFRRRLKAPLTEFCRHRKAPTT